MPKTQWVELVHDDAAGVNRVPGRPNVLAMWGSLGWRERTAAEEAVLAAEEARRVHNTRPVFPVPVADVPDGSVAEILAWVDGDRARAAAALAAETAAGGKARTSLIPQLEALAAGATTETENDNG